MTDTTAITEPSCADLCAFLSPRRWMTAQEVWKEQARLPIGAVRRSLRYLAEAGSIEGRIGGSESHPIREYRARK